MSLAEKQQSLIEDYLIIEDPMERFSAIVDLGRKAAPIPEDARVDENLVPGCTSQVWLTGWKESDGTIQFRVDADAPSIKGVAAMLCQLYSGFTAEEICTVEPEFIISLQIDRNLTPTRINGLSQVRKRLCEIAQA